ncbi:MAG TPA: hypothetical protein VGD40_13580 [Chryseosolibacter sp.]
MAKKFAVKKGSTFSPGKGKTWSDKINSDKPHEVKKNEKGFADITPGSSMLIATPKIVDDYVRQIPKGKEVTLQTMRKDLATEYNADYTCPVTAGIFLRIVAEAAHEQYSKGKPLSKITPFWRVIDENSTIGKKVSFGSDFIKQQRVKEGLNKEK